MPFPATAIGVVARSTEPIRRCAGGKVGWGGPSQVGRAPFRVNALATRFVRPGQGGPMPFVFDFDHTHARPPMELKDLLGGKGANLAEMTSVLELPVPPGLHHFDRRLPRLHGRRLAQGARRRGGERPRPAREGHGQVHRRRRRPLARVGALGCQVLHARHDGHGPQPRPQRRVRGGAGQADGGRALRLRLVPPLHRHVRPHRAGAAGRGVRLALRRRQGAGGHHLGRQGADGAAALPRRLVPADRRAPHRQALPAEARRAAAWRHRGRVPQLERSARHRLPRPRAHRPRPRHRRQRAGHGLRQPRRQLGHRRGLHP